MSNYALNNRVKVDLWLEFQAIQEETKEIAETVRKEYQRKSRSIESIVAKRHINKILFPISRIFNHRYKDDTLRQLLSSAVQKLQLCALEIESLCESKLVSKLRKLADILVSFLPKGEGIQLIILDDEEYYDEEAETNSKMNYFLEWRKNFESQIHHYPSTIKQNITTKITNSFFSRKKTPTQLSIRFNSNKINN